MRRPVPALAWVIALAACGGGPGGADALVDAATDVPGDAADVPGEAETAEPRVPLTMDRPLRLAWTVQDRQKPQLYDVRVGDPRDPDREKDVGLGALLAAVDPALDCNRGCVTDRDLRWLAVVTGETPPTGNTVQVFALSDDLVPTPVGDPLTDVRTFALHGSFLWYSATRLMCPSDQGQSRNCYDLVRVPLDPPGAPEAVARFPTPAVLYKSQFAGHFTASEDGRTLALLNPTPGTTRPWVWREGGEIRPLGDPICVQTWIDFSGDEVCLDEGGAYTDQDPLALSPDGRTLVWVVPWMDRELRLYRADVLSGALNHAVLLAVPPSGGLKSACYNRTWQFTSVLPSPRFSADGKTLHLVGQSLCGPVPQKPWTNLVSLPLAAIANGRVLDRGDLVWVTEFPEEYSPRCVTIQPGTVDLDPSGTFAVFAGTPRFQSDGLEIPDSPEAASAHTGDAEVWIARLDGSQEPGQITADFDTRTIGTQFAPAD